MEPAGGGFQRRKKAALDEAHSCGIVDVFTDSQHDRNGAVSIKTLELATDLVKKHGSSVYARLEERRKSKQ